MKSFKLKDYIILPKDVPVLGSIFWRWLHFTDLLGVLILVLYVFIFGVVFSLTMEPLFFFGFIIAVIYWGMDSRVAIVFALACLIAIPVMQILYNQGLFFAGDIWSERVAVWAYYFLVIGVVKQIFELRKS